MPEYIPQFNEEYLDYRKKERKEFYNGCPICGNEKPLGSITCSKTCASKRSGNVDWGDFDLFEMKKTMSYRKIGDIIGVSGAAVNKRMIKLIKELKT